MGTFVPATQDPVYAAIGSRWPREVIIRMLPKERVQKKLIASGHLSMAGAWIAACTHIERAALQGKPPPPETEVVHRILAEHSPEDL